MSKEAMKLALEALKYDADYDTSVTLQKAAIYALENAIAEVEKQEPYADVVSHWHYWMAEADKYRFALQNLEEALTKQEQGEPVAWTLDSLEQEIYENTREFVSFKVMEWLLNRLNTTPQQRKPLTDEQIEACLHHVDEDGIGLFAFARAIEAAHGIKE